MSTSRAETLNNTSPARENRDKSGIFQDSSDQHEEPHQQRDGSSLKQAMAAVDLEMALESLRHDDPFADLDGNSLEEQLEAELVVGLRSEEAQDAVDAGEHDVLLNQAASDVEQTCEEIAEEARTELLVQRMVEARNRLSASLSQQSRASNAGNAPQGNDSGGPAQRPAGNAGSNAFLSAFAARRLALACSVCAVALAGGIFLKASSDPDFALRLAHLLPAQTGDAVPQEKSSGEAGNGLVKAAMGLPAPPPAPTVRPVAAPADARAPDWREGLAARMDTARTAKDGGNSDSAEIALLETRLKQLQAHASRLQKSVDTAYDDELPRLRQEIEAGRDEIALLKQKIAELEARPAAETPEAAATRTAMTDTALPDRAMTDTSPAKTETAPASAVPRSGPAASPVLAYAGTAPQTPAEARVEAMAQGPEPRDPERVEIALAGSLGLEGLGADERATLKQRLVKGECLSTALSAVFDHVPVLAMRDLVRRLDGAC